MPSERNIRAAILVLRTAPRDEITDGHRESSYACDLLDDLLGRVRKKSFEPHDLEPSLEEIREAFEDEDADVFDLRNTSLLKGGMLLEMVQSVFLAIYCGENTALLDWERCRA